MKYTEQEIEEMAHETVAMLGKGTSAVAAVSKVAERWPEMTVGEFKPRMARAGEIIKDRMEETLEHEAGLKLVLDICAPAFAEHPDWTTGQCVDHLAALGDARAIALKNHWQAQMQADEPGRLRPPQQPRTWNVATTAPDTRSARRAAPSRAGGAS